MKKKHHNKDLSDISKDGWINIFIHPSIEPYFRLARFDRPIGTYLTMLPCLAALCQASKGVPSLYNLALFAIASLIMRSVGSIINDITDKKYDRHVERTRLRPLTNGDLTTYNAVIFLIILAIISFLLYFGLNESAQSAVLPIIPMMILYPFCKRFTNWPQVVLGFVFNWGMLVCWFQVNNTLPFGAFLMWVGTVFWSISYDTIYAYVDINFDKSLGLKSTAILFEDDGKKYISVFLLISVVIWTLSGYLLNMNVFYFIGMFVLLFDFYSQIKKIDLEKPDICFFLFKHNSYAGLVLLFSSFVGSL